MNTRRFDALTRKLATSTDRRGMLVGLLAGLAGGLAGQGGARPAAAQPRTPCRALGHVCRRRPGLQCCPGSVCRAGRCSCRRRQRRCGRTCIGRNQCCRNRCPGGAVCRRGRCRCGRGKQRCQGRCISRAACCRNAECGPGQVCRHGRCRCAAGFQPCQGGCIRQGACCGCPPEAVCRAGTCCPIGTSAALHAALAPGGPDTILLCPDTVYTGSFTLSRDVTIVGAGASRTVLDGENLTTVVTVEDGVTATLQGLGIRNGFSTGEGGGVHNSGTLTLIGCRIANNRTEGVGGGLLSFGTLTLGGTEVVANTCGDQRDGGGIWLDNGATLTMLNGSRVAGNTAGGDGGGIDTLGGTVILRDTSSVTGNKAGEEGGGIFYGPLLGSVGALRFEGSSVVADNTAADGGGIYVGDFGATGSVTFTDEACVRDNSAPQCVGTTCPVCPA